MTEKRKVYEEKYEAQLKEWNAEITLFNARADKAKVEAKIEYYKLIETLQGKQDTARMKLQELRTSDDDVWEDIRTGAENVLSEVTTAFKSVAERFEKQEAVCT
jgi:hypothetical protein